jgi:hypothetical protein
LQASIPDSLFPAMSLPTKPDKERDADGVPASADGMPARAWREDQPWEGFDPDDDLSMFEIDMKSTGSAYASRSELFEVVREIKDRLRRKG